MGVVGNEGKVVGGRLEVDGADKAGRFIGFWDGFEIGILRVVEVLGFLRGEKGEDGGIMREGGKVLYGYGEVRVRKMTVILRKGFGGGYVGK
ncbi:carboxyl transferase domain-containing protein, partial [Bacillus pumilus]|uniref:carboxyl transferase domain-containing protein n=1 Tax=Bacillus pumilus TaxID=1408 RepID=UPI0028CBB76C